MIYTSNYESPIGKILLASKENKLIGAWIKGQKYYLDRIKEEIQQKDDEEILIKTKKWFNKYFNLEKTQIS